jgi:hypothetical protein
MSKNLARERIGQIRKNNFGSLMEIVQYKDNKNILVRFLEGGSTIPTQYINFIKGEVSNPLDKTVYNVGFIGEGKYNTRHDSKDTLQYTTWYSMMQRCCDEKYKKKYPTYKECSVVDEWHNFQNFAKWYDENFYEVDGEKMCLDKDILFKGNKVYSPETCIFTPHKINTLFIKSDSKRGSLPLGVVYNKKINRYIAGEGNSKNKYIGSFKNPTDAFESYKSRKLSTIRNVADKYKSNIPPRLYETMINYTINITD